MRPMLPSPPGGDSRPAFPSPDMPDNALPFGYCCVCPHCAGTRARAVCAVCPCSSVVDTAGPTSMVDAPGSNVEGDADVLRNDDGNYFHAAAASGMRGWQTRRQFARHDADSTLSPATDNCDNRAPGTLSATTQVPTWQEWMVVMDRRRGPRCPQSSLR